MKKSTSHYEQSPSNEDLPTEALLLTTYYRLPCRTCRRSPTTCYSLLTSYYLVEHVVDRFVVHRGAIGEETVDRVDCGLLVVASIEVHGVWETLQTRAGWDGMG